MNFITNFQVDIISKHINMEYLIIGILFLVIGILVKFFPNILAGYSNLSQWERENTKTNRLPTITSLIVTIMGLIFIAGHFASIWLEQPELKSTIGMVVILGGAVAIVFLGNLLTNKRIS